VVWAVSPSDLGPDEAIQDLAILVNGDRLLHAAQLDAGPQGFMVLGGQRRRVLIARVAQLDGDASGQSAGLGGQFGSYLQPSYSGHASGQDQ
jgi:hypothetical protein